MQNIKVSSDIPLTEDQGNRLLLLVYGKGHFDYANCYSDGSGGRHELAALHLRLTPFDAVPGGETTLASIDAHDFGENSPFLYLEDADGHKTGWDDARAAIASRWHYGLILQDDVGDLWFCGIDEISQGEMTGDEPLRRLSSVTPDIVRFQNGEILDNLPADGEFWLSDEPEPKVTSIPWWGNVDPETEHLREEARAPMRALLDRIQTRIRALRAADIPEPSA